MGNFHFSPSKTTFNPLFETSGLTQARFHQYFGKERIDRSIAVKSAFLLD